MKRIKFTQTVQYESEGRGKGPIFEEGSIHDLEDNFADRWLRRGVAELVVAAKTTTPQAKTPEGPAVTSGVAARER
jgi:hypothetical protein